MDNSVSVHCKNMQCLAIGLHSVFNGISPDVMKDVFALSTSSNYNIRNRSTNYSKSCRLFYLVYNGTESLSHLALRLWELVPNDIKALNSLSEFKNAIRLRKPERCTCRICKSCITQTGFV